MTQEEVLRKADLTVADFTSAGKLPEGRAKAFIRTLIDQATLMPLCTVRSLSSHTEKLDKLKYGSRILRNANEGVALSEADRAKPDLAQISFVAKPFKAEGRMSYESLEDSIEQGNLQQTMMDLMSERVSLDMDEIVVKGDTASADTFLASFDGLLKQVTSNVYDHADATTNATLWKSLLKTMPTQFLRNKKLMSFLTSNDSEIDWHDTLANRATLLGDKFIADDVPSSYSGIPVRGLAQFPENIGTGSHCTSAVFMDPKNLHVGIWRDILVELERIPREGQVAIITSLRFDARLLEETACVKGNNVKVV